MESRISHRLLIYHSDSKIYEEILSKRLPQLKIHSAARPKEALDFAKEAEIILAWQIPDEVLNRTKRLRWFSSIGAGNENLVKNLHLHENVILTKAAVYGEMMAEYVFAYLLYFSRNVAKHLKDQKKRVWNRVRPGRLRGKVLGILGLGSVGKEIAKRGKQFGMRVLGLKRVPEPVENVILTPHVSGINLPEEISEEFVKNYRRWVKGKPLTGLVDRKKGY
jgi:glyoxylate/hydroxypyruvate reductase A